MLNNVAIYIRVSTQEQALEGYSIDAQTDRLTAYCKAKEWAIHDIYTDAGFSGSNTQRPALQRLINDVEQGRIDCVLVYKLDRLSRSQKDTLLLIEDVFLKNNVSFVSMNENFDTSTPFGRAMIGILSVFAQLEREQIKERMCMGRAERAKNGLWHGGGYRPVGYDYIDGRLVVNPTEKLLILDAYEMFLDHTPMTRISKVLSQKYGRTIEDYTLRSILTTPLYTGVIVWEGNTYKGRHEPIIDEVTFKRAQVLMNDRRRIAESKAPAFQPKSLLSGLLVCANCGGGYDIKGNYSGRGTNRVYRPYYYCVSRSKKRKKRIIDPTCMNPAYACVVLDKMIYDIVYSVAHDQKAFQKAAAKKDEEYRAHTDMEEKRRILMQRIDELDAQLNRIVDLYQLGTISIDQIGKRTQKLQEEKEGLQRTLSELTPIENTRLTLKEARTLLSTFDGVFSGDGIYDKRQFLQSIIQRIIILPTKGEFDIIWNF